MTKLFRVPKEKPQPTRKVPTLAACTALARKVSSTAVVSVHRVGLKYWAAADTEERGVVASAEHARKTVAMRALYAALVVLAEGK